MFKIDNSIKLFVFDLDDTLYRGDFVFPYAVDLVKHLQKDYEVIFLTNNSTKPVIDICNKLNDKGFECSPEKVYTSSLLTIMYCQEYDINDIYVIGNTSIVEEFRKFGLKVIQDETAKHVVVANDLNFNYDKITTAINIINKGGKFIACNQDGNFKHSEDWILPGCGAMVGAISYASNSFPDVVVGKPNSYGIKTICIDWWVKKSEVVVVGDLWDIDIKMALDFGSKAILIDDELTTKNKNLLIFKSIEELYKYCKNEV